MQYTQAVEDATMNVNRMHNHLISFIISAMITSAFLATAPDGIISAGAGPQMPAQLIPTVLAQVRGTGWHGTATQTIPISVAAPHTTEVNMPTQPTAPLSGEQLQKILKNLEERNKLAAVDRVITDSLGLTKNGEVLTLQYRALKDSQGIMHAFVLLNGNMGYLVSQRKGNESIIFHLDPTLKPVITIAGTYGQPKFSAVPLPDVEGTLQAELRYWANIADTMLSAKPQETASAKP